MEQKWELINFCEFDKFAAKSYCAIHHVNPELNLGDITQVDEKEIADFNMMSWGFPCFIAGTKVLTDIGYKNIEDIQVGDNVLTHKNRFRAVIRTGKTENKKIFRVKAQGIFDTYVTANHPFYIRQMKRIWDNEHRTYKRRFSDPIWKEVCNIKKGDFIGIPILDSAENSKNLTKEECYLIGRYIADGYIQNNKRPHRQNSYNHKVVFCIGKHKIDEFRKRAEQSQYNLGISEERTVFKVRIINEYFMNLCLECGKGAENKTIPNWILQLPIDYLKEFMNGYMSGDGCCSKNEYKATSVSKQLIESLVLCIQKCYHVGAGVYHTKRKPITIIEGRIVHQRDSYQIVFATDVRKQRRYEVIDGIVWYPIKEIIECNDVSDVYNLEVDEDNSYTANNAIVHNCTAISVAGKQEGFIDKNGNKTASGMYYEGIRILREKKPALSIIENVKNLTSKKFKAEFETVLTDLENAGYNTYWKVLNAKDYGIPQNRERVFIVSIRKDLDNGQFKFPESFDNGVRLKDLLEDHVDEKYYISDDKVLKMIQSMSDETKENLMSKACVPIDKSYNQAQAKEVSNCITSREDRGMSNHVSEGTAIAENTLCQIGHISNTNSDANRVYDSDNIARTLKANSGGGGGKTGLYQVPVSVRKCGEEFVKEIDTAHTLMARDYKGFSNQGQNAVVENRPEICSAAIRGRYAEDGSIEQKLELGDKDSAHALTSVTKDNMVLVKQATKKGYIECDIGGVADLSYPDSKTRRGRVQDNGNTSPTITATETGVCRIESTENMTQAEWKQHMYAQFIADADGYVCGVYTNQSKSFGYRPPTKDVSRTLKANAYDAGVVNGIRVRKLTPKECWRLMGFSDEAFNAAQGAGISNSQLYKQAGNSIVTDVLYYIYVELYKAMPYLFDDLKLSSFFSGIGAFEVALDRLYAGIDAGNFIQPSEE